MVGQNATLSGYDPAMHLVKVKNSGNVPTSGTFPDKGNA
ncbi:hypothetical protein LHGZ1_1660 [Laribacter hongkongensis]|uniref:Uncharacterized protein n=1 Tax=Laribacter hongkongensis TaxID=168471 RepID=A0A248LJ30_9NEIS|nr:hypothetical protein LHGZ1_1660 [Laribacter hongkongensis]